MLTSSKFVSLVNGIFLSVLSQVYQRSIDDDQ